MLREPRRLQTHLRSSASPSLSPRCTPLWHVAAEMSPVSCLPGTLAKHRAGAGHAWPHSWFAYIGCAPLQFQAGDPLGSCAPAVPPLSLHARCQRSAEHGSLSLPPFLEQGGPSTPQEEPSSLSQPGLHPPVPLSPAAMPPPAVLGSTRGSAARPQGQHRERLLRAGQLGGAR